MNKNLTKMGVIILVIAISLNLVSRLFVESTLLFPGYYEEFLVNYSLVFVLIESYLTSILITLAVALIVLNYLLENLVEERKFYKSFIMGAISSIAVVFVVSSLVAIIFINTWIYNIVYLSLILLFSLGLFDYIKSNLEKIKNNRVFTIFTILLIVSGVILTSLNSNLNSKRIEYSFDTDYTSNEIIHLQLLTNIATERAYLLGPSSVSVCYAKHVINEHYATNNVKPPESYQNYADINVLNVVLLLIGIAMYISLDKGRENRKKKIKGISEETKMFMYNVDFVIFKLNKYHVHSNKNTITKEDYEKYKQALFDEL